MTRPPSTSATGYGTPRAQAEAGQHATANSRKTNSSISATRIIDHRGAFSRRPRAAAARLPLVRAPRWRARRPARPCRAGDRPRGADRPRRAGRRRGPCCSRSRRDRAAYRPAGPEPLAAGVSSSPPSVLRGSTPCAPRTRARRSRSKSASANSSRTKPNWHAACVEQRSASLLDRAGEAAGLRAGALLAGVLRGHRRRRLAAALDGVDDDGARRGRGREPDRGPAPARR